MPTQDHHQQLIGKKQLLAWATTCSNIDCNKYDDLRDGLIPLVIFRNLFPNGIPSEVAGSIRSQLTMVASQRPARQNWMILAQLLKHGGVPPTIWDRRSVSAAHPKACYNFLVMSYFLHKLRAGGDFSVDFALPVDAELSNFLQSTKSLDIVNRAPMLQPISYKVGGLNTSTPNSRSASANNNNNNVSRASNNNNHQHQNHFDVNNDHYDAGASSSDATPAITPRLSSKSQTQQQQQQYDRNNHNNNNTNDFYDFRFNNNSYNGQDDTTNNNANYLMMSSPPSSQLQQMAAASSNSNNNRKISSPSRDNNTNSRKSTTPTRRNQQNNNNNNNNQYQTYHHQNTNSANAAAVIVPLEDSGWRYGLDTSHLGEGVILQLKHENSKLKDAVSLANEHVRATQRYCESQLKFAQENFNTEIKKLQLESQLQKMQLENQNAITVSMVQSSGEARVRDIERRIVAEKRESNWGVFAEDPIPEDCPHPQRWLSAQLDAARKQASNEKQHRIALENENAMLKEKNAKFMPLAENIMGELNEALEKLETSFDPDRLIEKTNESLDQIRQLAAVQYETKIETLELELEAANSGSNNSAGGAGKSSENNTNTNNNNEAIYKLQEQLVMTREQLARAEGSSSILRELVHNNCTTPMQKLDLSAFTLDPQSDELRRGVMMYSSILGTNSATMNENTASAHVRAITDIAAAVENIKEEDVEKIRDSALRFALMHQILEARVQSMAQNLAQVTSMLTQQEKETSQQQITFHAKMSELQSRHESDIQHLSAAKSADSATLQSEVQMLRSQVARENIEHNSFVQRQTEGHQAMAKDLQNQIASLRQNIGEVRRAEQLLLQRDQLWSALVDHMSVLASASASVDSKHNAEMKANQLREQIKKNAADLKSTGNNSHRHQHQHGNNNNNNGSGGFDREVADAVREAVAHSHQQLQGCLEELRLKQNSVQILEGKLEIVSKDNDQLRNLEKESTERKLMAEQELQQARNEMQNLQIRASDALTAGQRAKELMEALVMNTVNYIGDVCNQFNLQVARPSMEDLLVEHNNSISRGDRKDSSLSFSSGLMAKNNNNHQQVASIAGSAATFKNNNNTNPSSTSGKRASVVSITPVDTPNASVILKQGSLNQQQNDGNNSNANSQKQISSSSSSSSPPRLVAPKFQPIELSPRKEQRQQQPSNQSLTSSTNPATTTATSASSTGDATNAAADLVLDDFAKRQKEILSKYGIKT